MGFSYDFYNRLKQSRMFLANPQKTYIGVVQNAHNVKLKRILNNLYELEFVIYEKINGEYTENYDKYIKPRLIEVQDIGWFQIVSTSEKCDDSSNETYKTIKCYMLENVLIYRKIHNITGTFALYDISDREHSLLHIISNEVKWGIGHVSNSLLGLYRTFDIDSMEIYNFLTTKVSESYGCIITFDSYNKLINAYVLDEIGEDTNIVISRKNILREWEKNDDDFIVTKMAVYGGDDGIGGTVDIRAVNFGLNYLVNFDYFLSDEWMSTGLINAYNNYKSALSAAETSYNTNTNNLKTKLAELTVLKAELTDLISLQTAQSQVMGASVQTHGRVPIPSDSDYTAYQNAVTLYNTYTSQIASKNVEISAKQAEIDTIENILDNISNNINIENYLTKEQLNELDLFISEGDDFTDETYVQTDTMTSEEVINMKLELKKNAANELVKISQPRYTITIKASNLYTIQDNKDSLIPYEDWIEKFQLGNKILIKLRDNYSIIARLVSITVDFDNPSDIELTFTNKDRLEDSLIELAELIADSGRTAKTYTLKSFGYNKASQQTSSVREFINGIFNATKNAFVTNNNQEVLIDEYGLHGRKWLPEQNKYDDRQLWLNNNGMLLSSDGFKTAQLAIGLLTAPDGEQYYGIATDVLVGNLIIGEKLRLTGSGAELDLSANNSITGLDSKFTVSINNLTSEFTNYKNTTNDTLTTMQSSITQNATAITTKVSITDYNGDTIVSKINQSATKIEQSALNIDLSGYVTFNSLSTPGQTIIDGANLKTGTVVADTVRSSWVYTGSISADQITAGTISGDRISGGTIIGANFVSYFTYGGNTASLIMNVNNIGWKDIGTFPTILSPTYAQIPTLYCQNIEVTGASRISVNSSIDCSSTLTVNNYDVLTTNSTIQGNKIQNLYTNQIYASDTGYGNIDFLGFDNAAGVNWVQANFESKTPSDIRLKYNIQSLDNIPDELFYSLKPYQFKFKPEVNYGDQICFGLIAQQVENAFESFGLNPYDYDLIDVIDVRQYTDDGYYISDKTHRLNLKNLIAWTIRIIQKQNERIKILENNFDKYCKTDNTVI